MTGFGGRPRPSPVIRLFSFLLPKQEVDITVDVEGDLQQCNDALSAENNEGHPVVQTEPGVPEISTETVTIALENLAWGRSGDKGNKANIGIIARKREYMPYIMAVLTPARVAERFAHFLEGGVERFYMPGLPAVNFLLHDVLGGGGMASLRNDPQGKGYAQLLLDEPIEIPIQLVETLQ
jgi:hypothetical protein